MRAVWLVARWEYLTRIRSKFFVISTLLMPMLIVGLTMVPILLIDDTSTNGLTLAIADESGRWEQVIGELLDARYSAPDGTPRYPRLQLTTTGLHLRRSEAEALLSNGAIQAYLVVGHKFEENGEISYISGEGGDFLDQELIRRAVRPAWNRAMFERHQISPDLIPLLERDIAWASYAARGDKITEADAMQAFMTPMIYVMILFFAVFLSSQVLMRSIIAERSNRVVEILLSSITAQDLMAGKIIGLGFLVLTQVAIYLTVSSGAAYLSGMPLPAPADLGWFLAFALAGYFLYAALFAAVGSLFETEQEAQQVVGVMTIVPVLPLLFSSLVITQPDATLVRIASFIPPVTPFIMIIRLSVSTIPWWETTSTLIVLVLSTWLMVHWSGIVFRTAILMYGRRVTLAEIVRWLRQG
ncbi:MAG: ABC transporter permease [Candidatus Neomarinimicrobiota bacterium]